MKDLFSIPAVFPFRPWVRRAGRSIVLVAAAITAAIVLILLLVPEARWGWMGEKFVWVYVATLWAGGVKIWRGTRRPIAELTADTVTLRPLHQFRQRVFPWAAIRTTEQMIGGDRLMVWFETSQGLRFVALNLNLIKGRRELLTLIETKLAAMGFEESVVDRSRFLRAPGSTANAEH